MRLLLIDTDVFVLLAASGMVGRVAELLGCEPGRVRRLFPVEAQLRRGKRFLEKYDQPVRDAALVAARRVPPIVERPVNDTLLQQLLVPDIDEGEALMLALLLENPSRLLITGDRRSLVALAKHPNLARVRSALAGRLVCLEIVLRLLLINDGVEKIAAAFASVRDCDTRLRVIFSEANAASLESCLEGINSYLTALKREVGDDLLHGG